MSKGVVSTLEGNDWAVTRQDFRAALKAVQFAALDVDLQVVKPFPMAYGAVECGYVNPNLSWLGSFWKLNPRRFRPLSAGVPIASVKAVLLPQKLDNAALTISTFG
jgi:hypothetical protein